MAYVELYLDHTCWGERFFASPEVAGLLPHLPLPSVAIVPRTP